MLLKLRFHFNFDRSLQASAYLLKQAECQELPYIHLLKMLYIADREYLAEYGYPITGDRVVAMQYGPVLSHVLNLIKGKKAGAGTWQQFIGRSLRPYNVLLLQDPGDGELSRASTAKLKDVFIRFGKLKPFQVVSLTHNFSEWKEHYTIGTSVHIPLQAILQAQGAEKMIRVVESQIKLQRHQRALQKACQ